MPILYSVVARGTTILAKYASCTGNFDEVTENILTKIPPQNDKLTYSQGQYLFHYICENNIIYMCTTDADFQRSRAFLYLAEMKGRFLAAYGQDAQTAVPYAMNTDFARTLASTMKHYNESNQEIDVLANALGDLDELKDIMSKNIDNVAMRGERLELLVNKTENLTANSVTFRKTSRNLARSLFWKNVKIYVIVAAILIVVVYVIVSISCGGLAWPKCVGN
ncbi:vesicle-associated membrane protein 7 [Apis laboriosa]|uniref:Vesicle-associated membrane protein 7 n=3 Tax=Apis TaxID=7459 RepID=A0A7M6W8K2_APIME|nr:vesicle-associated membrane protein 7 [Apis mellifera]XP_006623369.1 vesicle-associated membrane protein 7 [Apis dorsata]XP_016920082.1 vesicle-associated membrane protein 7 [Apis cerana]XP_043796602.1 vesicle-associated membrane protein 7 [Apis laboriosa]XP_043796611.1 vesicle-associated membrane protein 7 [Apis laboriosa]KAG6803394.1 vesicle-associated membrane protein 7 [Apis mellifera caucasica]KAG9435356.1 vesicle-associated membrane protein 7 [Apis mellifera carnica]PBC34282.1 Vesic|eukprot:NP_001229456.1 vesicle-associated membrane protein 7 [Apis mellifera]